MPLIFTSDFFPNHHSLTTYLVEKNTIAVVMRFSSVLSGAAALFSLARAAEDMSVYAEPEYCT